MNVTTVLCCRMTPLQKASIVQLVQIGLAESNHSRGRSSGAPVTAAVGDGGNDVAMILQANVGIGIYGKEGREATRAADYALPQFRFLQRLILVHGHWSYHRITSTMLLFYEKCVLFVTVQILMNFYAGFTAVSWFESTYYILYNLAMTGLMYMTLGIAEKVLTADQLLAHPRLYRHISNQRNLRLQIILLHVANGMWQGVVIFFTVYLVLLGTDLYSAAISRDPVQKTGVDLFDFTLAGASCYMYTVLVANLRLLIYVRDFNLAFGVTILVTFVLNLTILLILQVVVPPTDFHHNLYYKLGQSLCFWVILPIVVYTALFPALIWRILSDMWWEKQVQKNSICAP
ncbi:unnamed protein product [Echinostoma caproni]|uniref:PhoLip_ATPase_C domain-containing protein n=1 Tax=Echinostoma caproni TaxID=27848 RepID=A0A183ALZ3_9TREM|nr:unnamed protein product [Echinostoma caproni]